MPELPEVETTCRGIAPHILQQSVTRMTIRQHQLRWPVPSALPRLLKNEKLIRIQRRGKYLLFHFSKGVLLWHLGMSGRMQILSAITPPQKHDHIDMVFSNQYCLRFTDPRRFGACLWLKDDPATHPLLVHMGPEPDSDEFNANYLHDYCQKRKQAIKQVLLDQKAVAGVGNIYAAEALHAAKIYPLLSAQQLTKNHCQKLVEAIQKVLQQAIAVGGSSLKDYRSPEEKLGYFTLQMQVYGRGGEACYTCKQTLIELVIAGRSTVYCSKCQPR
jgi:formamidopyrimidine-DNA glycosylase